MAGRRRTRRRRARQQGGNARRRCRWHERRKRREQRYWQHGRHKRRNTRRAATRAQTSDFAIKHTDGRSGGPRVPNRTRPKAASANAGSVADLPRRWRQRRHLCRAKRRRKSHCVRRSTHRRARHEGRCDRRPERRQQRRHSRRIDRVRSLRGNTRTPRLSEARCALRGQGPQENPSE